MVLPITRTDYYDYGENYHYNHDDNEYDDHDDDDEDDHHKITQACCHEAFKPTPSPALANAMWKWHVPRVCGLIPLPPSASLWQPGHSLKPSISCHSNSLIRLLPSEHTSSINIQRSSATYPNLLFHQRCLTSNSTPTLTTNNHLLALCQAAQRHKQYWKAEISYCRLSDGRIMARPPYWWQWGVRQHTCRHMYTHAGVCACVHICIHT